jgi:hypothetical protein
MADYRVVEKIGQGGMGVVYRAVQISLEREVALKLLIAEGASLKEKDLLRFSREVRSIARINHPNVIRILDYGQLDGRPFYAMEFLGRARPLDAVIKSKELPIPRVIAIARQLLEALAAIHAVGLIHRDLKPGNVMIDQGDHVTLMDFGLVKDIDASALTRAGSVIGTPRYLSPEAVRGQDVDGRSDLFSLGVMLHEALTGKPPFNADQLTALALQIVSQPAPPLRGERPEVPLWLADFIAGLMVKEVADRTPSATAALVALKKALGEPVGEAAPATAAKAGPESGGDEFALPQSQVIDGMDVLRQGLGDALDAGTVTPKPHGPTTPAADVTPVPPAVTTSRRTTRKPAVLSRASLSIPPPPPAAPARGALIAGGVALAAALVAVGFLSVRGGEPPPPSPSPSANAPASVASAAPPSASAWAAPVPAAPRELVGAVTAAVRKVAPRARIEEIRAALKPLKGRWFKTPPDPGMVRLRASFGERLAARMAESALPELLEAMSAARKECFTDPAVTPAERLDVYLLLDALEDLERFCLGFGIPLPRRARSAMWEGFGQLPWPPPEMWPAAGLSFKEGADVGWSKAKLPEVARWKIQEAPVSQRFHGSADPETEDFIRTFGEGPKTNLVYEHPVPLDIPLARVDKLEIGVCVMDLHENNRFEIDLGDASGWRTVAVIRGDFEAPARWFRHTVDRALFTGDQLRMRVRFEYMGDLNTRREYSYLFLAQVHYHEVAR